MLERDFRPCGHPRFWQHSLLQLVGSSAADSGRCGHADLGAGVLEWVVDVHDADDADEFLRGGVHRLLLDWLEG